jgi:hypothetical protein
VHSLDDLGWVDALQVSRGGAEVGVPELALDQGHGDPFAGQFDRVSVA